MPIVLTPLKTISEGAVRLCAVRFNAELDDDELLTGTPVVTELGTVDHNADGSIDYDADGIPEYTTSAHLALSNKVVNTATITIKNKDTIAGKAVQWRVSGQQKGNTYLIKVQCGTTSTPAETLVHYAMVRCV